MMGGKTQRLLGQIADYLHRRPALPGAQQLAGVHPLQACERALTLIETLDGDPSERARARLAELADALMPAALWMREQFLASPFMAASQRDDWLASLDRMASRLLDALRRAASAETWVRTYAWQAQLVLTSRAAARLPMASSLAGATHDWQTAEGAGLATTAVRHVGVWGRSAVATPAQGFARLMVLHMDDWASLSPAQFMALAALLERSGCGDEVLVRPAAGAVYCVIDIASDGMPHRGAELPASAKPGSADEHMRFVALAPAEQTSLAWLAARREVGDNGLGGLLAVSSADVEMAAQTLLACAEPADAGRNRRRHERRLVDEEVWAVVGLRPIRAVLAQSGRPYAQGLPGAGSSAAGVSAFGELASEPVPAPLPMRWRLRDRSDSGIGAELPAAQGDGLVPGTLVAFRCTDAHWQLGVVRRHVGREAGRTARLGIERLGGVPRLLPLTAAGIRGAAEDRPGFSRSVVRIPAIHVALDDVPHLLLETGDYAVGRQLAQPDEQRPLILGEISCSGPGWVLARLAAATRPVELRLASSA